MENGALAYVLLTFPLLLFVVLVYFFAQLYAVLRRDIRDLRRIGEAPASAVAAGSLGPQVQEMIAELRKTADQIGGDLALRSAVLQRQIDEADKKLAQIGEQVKALQQAQRTLAEAQPAPVAARETPAPELPRQRTAAPSGENGTHHGTGVAEFRPLDLRETSKYTTVLRLAEEGLDSLEIARRTRLGREEVELLLGLRDEGRNGEPVARGADRAGGGAGVLAAPGSGKRGAN